MPKGKSRIIATQSQPRFQCPLCDYVAKGEKSKELHFKYSHQLEYSSGQELDVGTICGNCLKDYRECSCVNSTRRI